MEKKIIDYHVFNPVNALFKNFKNGAAEFFIYHCNNSDNCNIYKKKQCILKLMFNGFCFYGDMETKIGYTRKSKKFSDKIREMNEKYKKYEKNLCCPSVKINKVGDYFYLPYAHMDLQTTLPFKNKLLHKDYLTKENLLNIINHKPKTLFGNEEIKKYQQETVPLFITHLKEEFPELFEQIKNDITFKKVSNVGRKAVLSSIAPGAIFTKEKEQWLWDGETLTSTTSRILFPFVKYKENKITLVPEENITVIITDENQVNENTIFED